MERCAGLTAVQDSLCPLVSILAGTSVDPEYRDHQLVNHFTSWQDCSARFKLCEFLWTLFRNSFLLIGSTVKNVLTTKWRRQRSRPKGFVSKEVGETAWPLSKAGKYKAQSTVLRERGKILNNKANGPADCSMTEMLQYCRRRQCTRCRIGWRSGSKGSVGPRGVDN